MGPCLWPASDDVLDALADWGLAGSAEPEALTQRGGDGLSPARGGLSPARTGVVFGGGGGNERLGGGGRGDEEFISLSGLESASAQDLVSMIWGYSSLLEQVMQFKMCSVQMGRERLSSHCRSFGNNAEIKAPKECSKGLTEV